MSLKRRSEYFIPIVKFDHFLDRLQLSPTIIRVDRKRSLLPRHQLLLSPRRLHPLDKLVSSRQRFFSIHRPVPANLSLLLLNRFLDLARLACLLLNFR